MERVVIVVKGEVQRVGYRDEVQRAARKLNIKGCVENIKPYDVRIVAEGEEKDLEKFIRAINIKRFPIEVESLDVKWDKATDEFEYFEIKRGPPEEELGERLDAAAKYLFRSVQLGEKSVKLGERSVALGERSVKLSEKSVALEERSVALGERSVEIGEKMLEKQDKMLEKQDQTISEVKKVGEKVEQGFSRMDQNFTRMDAKYDKISKTTERILEQLAQQQRDFTDAINRLTNAILKLAEKSGR